MVTIEDYFNEKVKLPTPPTVALKILDTVRNEKSSMDDVAKVVTADPALTARILKVANSSLYNLRVPVNSIAQATVLMGSESIRNIALAFVIVEEFSKTNDGAFDIELFWRRAITSSVAAEQLAETTGLNDPDIFISALLQDIGVLVIFLSDPVNYSMMLEEKRLSGTSLVDAEQDLFGFSHVEVGGLMLENWGLPESICRPILLHHAPDKLSPYNDSANHIRLSNQIASIYHGMNSASRLLIAKHNLKNTYGFSDSESEKLIDLIGAKAREVITLFAINPGEMKPFSWIVQEANAELSRLSLSYEQLVLALKQSKDQSERLARELKISNSNLREKSCHDELTGLYRRQYFFTRLEKEVSICTQLKRSLSLIMINIDDFKEINEQHGYLVGDQVLERVAQLIKTNVREHDIVARHGNAEFAVLLPNTELNEARILAKQICGSINLMRMKIEKNKIIRTTVCSATSAFNPQSDMLSPIKLLEQCEKAISDSRR